MTLTETERRVLGHVNDGYDHGSPRNSPEALSAALGRDVNFSGPISIDDVTVVLDELASRTLVERREDGTFAVTDDGSFALAS